MEKEVKKYHIKESELKEIIKETILLEAWDPNAFKANFENGKLPQGTTAYELFSKVGPATRGLINSIIPDSWKERIEAGDSRFLQWLLGALGANSEGVKGPDYFTDMKDWKMFGGEGGNAPHNPNAEEPFNVAKAVKYLVDHATPYYSKFWNGQCAAHVRAALNSGGLGVPYGMRATAAKYYINILPNNGWVRIDPSQAGQVGDVCVVNDCVTRDGKRHRYGHISMCCGNNLWVSDYIQKTMHGLSSTPPANQVFVFRYRNIV